MLLSYSVLPLLKQKYPFANITFGTNTFYSTFFRRADIIDNVIMQSCYNNKLFWTQYDYILSESFALDSLWEPDKILGDLDRPENWKKCPYKLSFSFPKSDWNFNNIEFDDDKIKIGVFYTLLDRNDPMVEAFHILPQKWEEIINGLNDRFGNLEFYFFTTDNIRVRFNVEALDIKKRNVRLIGPINSVMMALLSKKLNYIIGESSPVTTTFFSLFPIDKIILSSIEDNGSYMWDGIPDECIMPHIRFKVLAGHANNNLFVYPDLDGKVVKWETESWGGVKKTRNMLSVNNIDVNNIIEKMTKPVNCGGLCFDFCSNCLLKKNSGKCVYWWA